MKLQEEKVKKKKNLKYVIFDKYFTLTEFDRKDFKKNKIENIEKEKEHILFN